MTRRRKALCAGCRDLPPRRVLNATLCTPCFNRQGRPQKRCGLCDQEFASDTMNGRRCRPCASKLAHGKRIAEVYGLTAEMYQELLDFQEGACYICRRKPASKRLAVDHDHATGAVRGLLCKNDNRFVLGSLKDDIAALQRAIDYLTLPPAKRLWPDVDVRPEEG